MSSEKQNRKVSDIKLEQYYLGELPRSEMYRIERVLETDQECRERFSALKKSNKDLLEQYPSDVIARKIRLKMDGEVKGTSRGRFLKPGRLAILSGAAAAIILLFIFIPGNFIDLDTINTSSTERIKGQDPHIRLYRKTTDGSEELENGAVASQGDVIRIGYHAIDRSYGIILSIDGRGIVTLHWPRQGTHSARLMKTGIVLLDFAIELDDAPDWERFYFITNNDPFDVDPVLQAARKSNGRIDGSARLNLSKDYNQFIFILEKGAR